jgi:hypothetical protein
MKNVLFIKLNTTNINSYIISLINSIIYAINVNKKVIVFDNIYIDLNITNDNLLKYNIRLIDKKTLQFKINAILYGERTNIIDITNMLINSQLFPSNSYVSKLIVNDPSPSFPKQLYYNYSINEIEYDEIYNDYIEKDLYFNIKDVKEQDSNDVISDKSIFDIIAKNIFIKKN